MSSDKRKRFIEDLFSDHKETVVSAVEALGATDLSLIAEDHLISIVRDFKKVESMAPLWAMIVLKRRASLASVPELLAVLDSDDDYYCEAAAEALISIAQAYPDETLDLLEDFIWDRIDHDPWDARLFAYEPVAALKDNPRAKSFLIKMFEVDYQWRDSIGNDLAGFGDRGVLVLLRRALEFAEQTKDQLDQNEFRYAYARLAGAPIQQFDDLSLWRKPWTERWAHALAELGKEQDIIDEFPEVERTSSLLRDDNEKEFEQEQKVIKGLPLADFSLRDYLAIRARGDLEQRFDEALRLLGLDSDWTVETMQTFINASSNLTEVISRVVSSHQFASPLAIETFASLLGELWNATPREDLHGLSPQEMLEVPALQVENERINKKRAEWKTALDVPEKL